MEITTSLTPNITTNSVHIDGNSSEYIFTSPISKEFYIAYNFYLYIMMFFGVIGNSVVLVVFLKHAPSTTTDWFIVFITVCDFISSLVNVPVYATFTNGYWQIYGTTLICRLHMFISQSLVLSSSFLISGLALDRYLKVCRPLITYPKQRARNACIIISTTTMMLSTPCFIMFENRRNKCVITALNKQLFIYYIMVFLVFIFATSVVVFSYYKVTKVVTNSEKMIARHRGITGKSNTSCCFLQLSLRRNRIEPTENMSRSGMFRDSNQCPVIIDNSSNSTNAPNTVQLDKSRPTSCNNHHPNLRSKTIITSVANLTATAESSTSRVSTIPATRTTGEPSRVSLRTTRISFLVCSVFIITWLPPWLTFILSTVDGMTTNITVVKFMIFGKMTYLINCMANPIIYTWLNNKFRKHILAIFCCRIE